MRSPRFGCSPLPACSCLPLWSGVVDSIFGGALSVQLANAGAFAALWIVRYLVFHHVIWGDKGEATGEAEPTHGD